MKKRHGIYPGLKVYIPKWRESRTIKSFEEPNWHSTEITVWFTDSRGMDLDKFLKNYTTKVPRLTSLMKDKE